MVCVCVCDVCVCVCACACVCDMCGEGTVEGGIQGEKEQKREGKREIKRIRTILAVGYSAKLPPYMNAIKHTQMVNVALRFATNVNVNRRIACSTAIVVRTFLNPYLSAHAPCTTRPSNPHRSVCPHWAHVSVRKDPTQPNLPPSRRVRRRCVAHAHDGTRAKGWKSAKV